MLEVRDEEIVAEVAAEVETDDSEDVVEDAAAPLVDDPLEDEVATAVRSPVVELVSLELVSVAEGLVDAAARVIVTTRWVTELETCSAVVCVCCVDWISVVDC